MALEPQASGDAPWSRVAILTAALVVAAGIAKKYTGSILPTDPKASLLFQNGLLLIVLGSAILEAKFTKPADSLVNSLMGIVTLPTVYHLAPAPAWWAVFGYCLGVLLTSTACVALSTGPQKPGLRSSLIRITYEWSTLFGKARILFSVVFLFALLTFYGVQSPLTISLVLFWGIFIAIWPLGLPGLVSRLFPGSHTSSVSIGSVIRTDWPNVVHAEISPDVAWKPDSPKMAKQADGVFHLVLPLYAQTQGPQRIGTGLCVASPIELVSGLVPGTLYEIPQQQRPTADAVNALLNAPANAKLIGFVVEGSTIEAIKVETWATDACREGRLLWVDVGADRVYYQITDGANREDVLQANHRGFQIASAAQLGTVDKVKGFVKYTWLPTMNSPAFLVASDFGAEMFQAQAGQFSYGIIPNSAIKIGGPFAATLEHHTAILGATGSGKTELAFDLIRHAATNGTKVICIDLTAKYEERLADADPEDLSLSHELQDELSAKIFAAETGRYGAGEEKKTLKELDGRLRTEVTAKLEAFLTNEDASGIGILALEEISNTKATLHVTELYLTGLLQYARAHTDTCPRVLIVLEEAHTVIPEASTMGLGDNESRGLVGKIAQIALQGRKYGVGLLVIAQRTATVSKTVLTQCNTIISFACIDDTSLTFLNNVFGSAYTRLIPNLPPLHAVIFGKGVQSQRPLVISIPFDPQKVIPD